MRRENLRSCQEPGFQRWDVICCSFQKATVLVPLLPEELVDLLSWRSSLQLITQQRTPSQAFAAAVSSGGDAALFGSDFTPSQPAFIRMRHRPCWAQ